MSCFSKWSLFDSTSKYIINYAGLKQVANYCRHKIHEKSAQKKKKKKKTVEHVWLIVMGTDIINLHCKNEMIHF